MSNLPPSGEIPRGAIRFNTDSNKPELWDGSQWAEFQLSTPNLGRTVIGAGVDYSPGWSPSGVDNPGDAFDGLLTTKSGANGGNFGPFTYTFSPAITNVNTARMRINLGASPTQVGSTVNVIKADGTDVTAKAKSANAYSTVGPQWIDVTSEVGDTWNTFQITGTSGATNPNVAAVEVNGQIIVSNLSNERGPGARGLSGGGFISPGRTNIIDYFNIASTGNALDFGDLFTGSYGYALSSSTRGIWGGGPFDDGGSVSVTNRIEFVTISSTGDGTDFGDLLAAKSQMNQGCSNATRGLFSGGGPQPSRINTIEYITMSSAGNAQDFGDLTRILARAGSVSSPTRGIFAGGTPATNGGVSNIIDFVTIATTGNAHDFGDLTFEKTSPQSCSNAIRGLFGGSGPPPAINIIDYVTIASTGNAVKFGELTDARFFGGACSSSTNGVFVGGYNDKVTIDYVKIATEGNAVDFGDLPHGVSYNAAVSNAHGGL